MAQCCRVPGAKGRVGCGGRRAGWHGVSSRSNRPAGPKALVAVTPTDAARERRQGVAGKGGTAPAHVGWGPWPRTPWCVGSVSAPCQSLGISGHPPAPLPYFPLTGQFPRGRQRCPSRRVALAPFSRERGAHARCGLGGGTGARCGYPDWPFLNRAGPARRPGACVFYTCQGRHTEHFQALPQAFSCRLPVNTPRLNPCLLFPPLGLWHRSLHSETFPRVFPSSRPLLLSPHFL